MADMDREHDVSDRSSTGDPYPAPRYAWYVVGVLTLVYIFSFIDRQILSLLVAPIRTDLHISDTQISLLSGFSFAIFYVSFGIPVGRIADSKSRTGLIALGFTAWSAFTAACGLAGSFVQLAAMRMGVGVGEATLSPAAYSLITDYFPPQRRAVAQGVYNMGIYIGSGVALLVGGIVAGALSGHDEYMLPIIGSVKPWQLVFLVIGAAGVCVVPIMLTVREPMRQNVGESGVTSVPLSQVVQYVKRNFATYTCHNVGIAMLSFSSYGINAWMPSYLIRHFHWTPAHVGVVLGTNAAVAGSLAVFTGGWIADRLAMRGHQDAYIRVALWSAVLWFPPGIAMLLTQSTDVLMVCLASSTFFGAAAFGIGPASLMQVTPQRMRGQIGAVYLFVVNLIGLGIGPTAVAMCTDYLFHDDNMVGSSILVVACAAHLVSAMFLSYGRKPFVRTIAFAKTWATENA